MSGLGRARRGWGLRWARERAGQEAPDVPGLVGKKQLYPMWAKLQYRGTRGLQKRGTRGLQERRGGGGRSLGQTGAANRTRTSCMGPQAEFVDVLPFNPQVPQTQVQDSSYPCQ